MGSINCAYGIFCPLYKVFYFKNINRLNILIMKKTIIFLLFSVIVTTYVSGQISVTLDLPNPCNSVNIDTPEKETDALGFSIIPNPNDGEFILNISSKEVLGKVSIHILGIRGDRIFSEEIYCKSMSCIKKISLDYLSKGIYIISVNGEKYKKTGKLVIK